MIHWTRKVRQAWWRRNGTCYEVVGPSILQENSEIKWGIILLMHGKAFVALISSKSSLSSLQETFSGLCLNEKLDVKVSLPRKSSGFGTVAMVYLYFVVLHYIPTPILCQSSSSKLGERQRKERKKAAVLDFVGKSTTFLMKRLIKAVLCHY